MKKVYRSPEVLRVVDYVVEHGLMAGSIVDNIPGVSTDGQQVGGYFDDSEAGSTFNHDWGN